jgi:hypothetical protein
MPQWLERAKNDYLQRKISRHDIDDMHDAARKAALKDQEVAGIDLVSDGELQRDNMIDLLRREACRRADRSRVEALVLRFLRQRRARQARHGGARSRRRGPVPEAVRAAAVESVGIRTAHAGQADPQRTLPVGRGVRARPGARHELRVARDGPRRERRTCRWTSPTIRASPRICRGRSKR